MSKPIIDIRAYRPHAARLHERAAERERRERAQRIAWGLGLRRPRVLPLRRPWDAHEASYGPDDGGEAS